MQISDVMYKGISKPLFVSIKQLISSQSEGEHSSRASVCSAYG